MSDQDSKTVESQVDDDDKKSTEPNTDPDPSGDPADKAGEPDDGADVGGDGEQDLDGNFDAKKALAKIRKQNSELKGLRARAQEAEQKANKTSEEKDREIGDLQTQLLRERVARKTGLPDQLVERLNGDDEEAMLTDAESLLEMFAKTAPPSTRPHERLKGGGRPEDEPEETDVRKIAERMFRR